MCNKFSYSLPVSKGLVCNGLEIGTSKSGYTLPTFLSSAQFIVLVYCFVKPNRNVSFKLLNCPFSNCVLVLTSI